MCIRNRSMLEQTHFMTLFCLLHPFIVSTFCFTQNGGFILILIFKCIFVIYLYIIVFISHNKVIAVGYISIVLDRVVGKDFLPDFCCLWRYDVYWDLPVLSICLFVHDSFFFLSIFKKNISHFDFKLTVWIDLNGKKCNEPEQ